MSTEKPEDQGKTIQADALQSIMGEAENLDGVLAIYLDKDAEIDALEIKIKDLSASRAIAEQAVLDKMAEQGISNFKALGKSVTRSERIIPSVLKDDRENQMEWLRENGAASLITETVNSNTFGAYIRSTFIEPGNEDKLPSFIKVFREPKLLIRTVAK